MFSNSPAASSAAASNPALIYHVANVHSDDIHGICVINENNIVSGSKDATVKHFRFDLSNDKWQQKVISAHHRVTPKFPNPYKYWVTALDLLSDSSVVAGFRDCKVVCKNPKTNNTFTDTYVPASTVPEQPGKARNEHRITAIKCLQPMPHFKYSALIGMPQQFQHYDFSTNKIVGSFVLDNPEWVYGFCQINTDTVVAIHSCTASIFKFEIDSSVSTWSLQDTIAPERRARAAAPQQKPFISSVLPIDLNRNLLALAIFGGQTKVLDIESKKSVHTTQEHTGRVWQSVPFSAVEYISCADDASIKVWDIRAGEKSMLTYADHPGRVSSVAMIRDSVFVAGTCADQSFTDKNKGQFYFYDMRKSGSTKMAATTAASVAVDEADNLMNRLKLNS